MVVFRRFSKETYSLSMYTFPFENLTTINYFFKFSFAHFYCVHCLPLQFGGKWRWQSIMICVFHTEGLDSITTTTKRFTKCFAYLLCQLLEKLILLRQQQSIFLFLKLFFISFMETFQVWNFWAILNSLIWVLKKSNKHQSKHHFSKLCATN